MLSILLQTPAQTFDLQLEHSLRSISKWETIWEKPFMTKDPKSYDEIISYVKCMSQTPVEVSDLHYLNKQNVEDIIAYIHRPMTALKFKNEKPTGVFKPKTAEYFYWLMISLNVPIEFENWNFERLVALLRYIGNKSSPKKKMSKQELLRRNHELNEKRLKEAGL